jgi:hypothetical protein
MFLLAIMFFVVVTDANETQRKLDDIKKSLEKRT